MSYMTCTSHCVGCGELISYNPSRVPSIRVNGEKQALCLECATKINQNRIKAGMDACFIPPDAYEPLEVDI